MVAQGIGRGELRLQLLFSAAGGGEEAPETMVDAVGRAANRDTRFPLVALERGEMSPLNVMWVTGVLASPSA